MSTTRKGLSERDANQTLKGSFNDVDSSLTTSGFLIGKVGRKVEAVISTTNIANDTITYSFSEDGNALYTYEIIYTDGTRTVLLSAERIA
jgi:hypothetical protein